MDKVDKSIVLENDPKYFHKVSTDVIAHTPAYDKLGNGNNVLGINFHAFSPEASFVGGLGAELTPDREIYVCEAPIDLSVLHPFTQLYTFDYSDEDEWIFDGINTPFFAYTDKGIEYYAMQANNTYKMDKPQWETLPYDPALTFAGNDNIKFGDNFAVCVTAVQTDSWAVVPFSYMAPECYYGNYGENRLIDLDVTEASVKYNGEVQDMGDSDLYSWAEQWAQNDHTPGLMTYIFTNKNISIDGMTGQNVCEVSFTEGAEDTTPPTLQRIMMRDGADMVTNKFETEKGATVNLVGGDFIENEESLDIGGYYPMTFTYYTFAEADWIVEYAPYGSTEYHPFEVNADPAKFFMPGFGSYMTGSLEQVTEKSDNGWYDLKVTLTDKAGNTQMQTISPAFKIENLSGISEISAGSNGFAVVNNSIVSNDGSEVEVYNLTGAKVVNAGLRPGIYIARSESGCAKVAVK